MGKLSNTNSLMKSSFGVFLKDKELLVFPAVSFFCCVLVFATFAVPLMNSEIKINSKEMTTQEQVLLYSGLFIFYFINYFIIVFFNSAVVGCAIIRMSGGDPTVADGFKTSLNRLPQIISWAFVCATVGLVLKMIEGKSKGVGTTISKILGMAWTAASFLVIPILVIEKKGPIEALKDSGELLKKTWGEQIVGNFSFGIIFSLLSLPGVALLAYSFVLGFTMNTVNTMYVAYFVIALAYLILLSLISGALQSIFQAALYMYANDAKIPDGFDGDLLQGAMIQK